MERAAPLLRQVSSLLARQPCMVRAALCIGSLPVYHPTSCGVYRELGRASMQLAQVLEQGHLASDVGLCGRGVSDCEPRHHPAYEHDISASPDVDPLRGSRGRSNRDFVRYLLRATEHSVRRLHGGPVRGGRDQDVRSRREGLFRDRSQATPRVKINFLEWCYVSGLVRIDAAATTRKVIEGTPFRDLVSAQAPQAQAHLAVPSGQVEASAGAAAGAGRGDKAPRLAARLPLPDVPRVCLHRRDGRGRVRVLVQARRVWVRGNSFCEISSERTVFVAIAPWIASQSGFLLS